MCRKKWQNICQNMPEPCQTAMAIFLLRVIFVVMFFHFQNCPCGVVFFLAFPSSRPGWPTVTSHHRHLHEIPFFPGSKRPAPPETFISWPSYRWILMRTPLDVSTFCSPFPTCYTKGFESLPVLISFYQVSFSFFEQHLHVYMHVHVSFYFKTGTQCNSICRNVASWGSLASGDVWMCFRLILRIFLR